MLGEQNIVLGQTSKSERRSPRVPSGDVIKKFFSLVGKALEPLGSPGTVLVGPLTTEKTWGQEVLEAVDEFDLAVVEQEIKRDQN